MVLPLDLFVSFIDFFQNDFDSLMYLKWIIAEKSEVVYCENVYRSLSSFMK